MSIQFYMFLGRERKIYQAKIKKILSFPIKKKKQKNIKCFSNILLKKKEFYLFEKKNVSEISFITLKKKKKLIYLTKEIKSNSYRFLSKILKTNFVGYKNLFLIKNSNIFLILNKFIKYLVLHRLKKNLKTFYFNNLPIFLVDTELDTVFREVSLVGVRWPALNRAIVVPNGTALLYQKALIFHRVRTPSMVSVRKGGGHRAPLTASLSLWEWEGDGHRTPSSSNLCCSLTLLLRSQSSMGKGKNPNKAKPQKGTAKQEEGTARAFTLSRVYKAFSLILSLSLQGWERVEEAKEQKFLLSTLIKEEGTTKSTNRSFSRLIIWDHKKGNKKRNGKNPNPNNTYNRYGSYIGRGEKCRMSLFYFLTKQSNLNLFTLSENESSFFSIIFVSLFKINNKNILKLNFIKNISKKSSVFFFYSSKLFSLNTFILKNQYKSVWICKLNAITDYKNFNFRSSILIRRLKTPFFNNLIKKRVYETTNKFKALKKNSIFYISGFINKLNREIVNWCFFCKFFYFFIFYKKFFNLIIKNISKLFLSEFFVNITFFKNTLFFYLYLESHLSGPRIFDLKRAIASKVYKVRKTTSRKPSEIAIKKKILTFSRLMCLIFFSNRFFRQISCLSIQEFLLFRNLLNLIYQSFQPKKLLNSLYKNCLLKRFPLKKFFISKNFQKLTSRWDVLFNTLYSNKLVLHSKFYINLLLNYMKKLQNMRNPVDFLFLIKGKLYQQNLNKRKVPKNPYCPYRGKKGQPKCYLCEQNIDLILAVRLPIPAGKGTAFALLLAKLAIPYWSCNPFLWISNITDFPLKGWLMHTFVRVRGGFAVPRLHRVLTLLKARAVSNAKARVRQEISLFLVPIGKIHPFTIGDWEEEIFTISIPVGIGIGKGTRKQNEGTPALRWQPPRWRPFAVPNGKAYTERALASRREEGISALWESKRMEQRNSYPVKGNSAFVEEKKQSKAFSSLVRLSLVKILHESLEQSVSQRAVKWSSILFLWIKNSKDYNFLKTHFIFNLNLFQIISDKQIFKNSINYFHFNLLFLKIYKKMNFFINNLFWLWAKLRHNNKPTSWVFKKYWIFVKNRPFFYFSGNSKIYYLMSYEL